MRKAVVVFGVTAALLALDLWTKYLAEIHLATATHPLPITVQSDQAGHTIADLIGAKFTDLSESECNDLVTRHVVRLTPQDRLEADARVFGERGANYPRLYVFSRGSTDMSPRVLRPTEFRDILRWVRLSSPELAAPARREETARVVAKWSLPQYLMERIGYLDEDEAETVAASLTYAAPAGARALQPTDAVKEGEIYLVRDRRIGVIEGLFRFTYAENPGAAWGFLATAEKSFRHLFFICVSCIAIVVILLFVRRIEPHQTRYLLAFACILSGALGNFVDRVRFRYVIDFIDMYVGEAHWPTYNVADIAITVGVGLLLLDMLFGNAEDGLFAPETDPTD